MVSYLLQCHSHKQHFYTKEAELCFYWLEHYFWTCMIAAEAIKVKQTIPSSYMVLWLSVSKSISSHHIFKELSTFQPTLLQLFGFPHFVLSTCSVWYISAFLVNATRLVPFQDITVDDLGLYFISNDETMWGNGESKDSLEPKDLHQWLNHLVTIWPE